MERRKFLIGAGSLAAGGAAALGSGAFTSVRAKRGLEIDVSGDRDAFVGIDPNLESQFVGSNNGTVYLDFASNNNQGGKGVNNDAATTVRPGFTLTNQAQETIHLELSNRLSNNDITSPGENNGINTDSDPFTAPAGLDVQFIAMDDVASASSQGDLALIGRDNDPTFGPLGSEFNEADTNLYYFHNLSQGANARTELANAGHLVMDPGTSVDVVVKVVANGVDLAGLQDKLNDANTNGLDVNGVFGIEAYGSQSATTYDMANADVADNPSGT